MSAKLEVPSAWAIACLDDVSEISPEVSVEGLSDDQLVHFVPMAAVAEDFANIDVTQLRPIRDVRKGYTAFATGDVLLAKITPCMENGKGGLVPCLQHGVAFGSTEFHVLRASAAVTNNWLSRFLSQPAFRKLARANMTGTAGQMRVPTKWLRGVEIPVPPVAEQTRIVAKLEELLSDLDAGVAELKAAQKKLVLYRQSLLKAAVEGALTADWRDAQRFAPLPPGGGGAGGEGAGPAQVPHPHPNPSPIEGEGLESETGAQLLTRILTERRARWEAKQLAKFTQQGKTPPKDWQKNYPEPVQPDTTGLPTLPEGWVWSSLDQLTEFVTSGSRGWAEYYSSEGATFIRSQNINKDRLDLSDIAFVDPPRSAEGARTKVRKYDLLLTITGANVGKAACVDVEIDEAYVSQHVSLIRVIEVAMSEFLHMFLTSSAGGRGQLNREAYGAGKPGLNLQQVAAITVPISGMPEVRALMESVAMHLKATSEQEAAIATSLKQSTAQRQNILRAAFAGQLVPQDPNDEPASVLLERIRAEKDQGTRVAKRRHGKQRITR